MRLGINAWEQLKTRLASGEDVSFGEGRKLFADLGLRIAFQNLEDEKGRLEDFWARNLVPEGYEGEPPELTRDQQITFELEYLRLHAQTLGVRPSMESLQPYATHAIETSNWELLHDVVGFSHEGAMDAGSMESLAVVELIRNEEGYNVLKERFGPFRFTEDHAKKATERALIEGKYQSLPLIKTETGHSWDPKTIQDHYAECMGQYKFDRMGWCTMHTQLPIEHNTTFVNQLCAALSEKTLGDSELDQLIKIATLNDNPETSKKVQKETLANNRAQFFQLFYNLDHELDASPIQDALDAHGDDEYEEAAKLSLNTKTSPRPETAKKLHTRLFEENMLPLLSELESSTGQPISLDRDRAIVALQWNLRDKEIESFFYGAEIAHKAGIAIPESMMDEAATESLQVQLGTPHWAEAVDKVKKEYAKAGHDPSATLKEYEGIGNFANHVTAVWLARDKHTYGGIRPLHEMAIQKNYDAFRKEACRLVQDMIDTAPSLPETWPDKEQKLENLYSILLDLALAQTLKGQKTVVKAQQLAEATNHPISIDCMVQGLARHVKSHANQTDPDLLAKLAERGITIDGKAIYERVAEIVLKEGEEFGKRLAYLQSITKGTTITEKMQELGRQHAVRCLINSHIDDYDRLLAAGIKLELITGDQERLKAAALDLLGNEDLDPFDSFKERIPFTLEIDADEADEVLESYFETYPGTTPSVVASRMNVPVPEDKVQREYHFLVPSADNEYNWEQVFFHLDRMKELYDDTEFAPTESVCWEFLEAVGSSLRPRVFARLQEDVVYNPTPEQAEMIFERLECNMDISMSQEFKLATKMIELGHHPDVEIKRDLIVNTLATTRKFRDLRWDVIQAYTTRGYVVADDVIEDWVATGFKHVGNRNYDLINVLHHLDSDLQRSDYGSDDQARTACTLIDHEFDIHPAEQNSEGTNTEPIGWVYERAGMKQSATDRATKLFNDDHLYAGFAYCVIAEVKPDLATAEVGELSRRYEHGLSNRMFLKRFNGDEKDQFRAMLEAWK